MFQAAAIPFRKRKGRTEFCLITSRKGKWIFPKGIIDPGETVDQTALKEAHEEAGLRGRIAGPPLGQYEFFKWKKRLTVTVLLMEVTTADDVWEEAAWRQRTWVSWSEAMSLISRQELKQLLEAAADRIAENGPSLMAG
jgi:8-oxo-dGTP pyrophosphatase MutT (NUDIX family)